MACSRAVIRSAIAKTRSRSAAGMNATPLRSARTASPGGHGRPGHRDGLFHRQLHYPALGADRDHGPAEYREAEFLTFRDIPAGTVDDDAADPAPVSRQG